MRRTLHVAHLARVEGHGGFEVVLDAHDEPQVRVDIFEGIRLFERLLVGRNFTDVPAIASRVCAICSHCHAITAAMALERALEVQVSPEVQTLRDLAFQGEVLESHALHVFLLALPDLLGQPSVVELARAAPDAVKLGLRLKRLGNRIREVVGGRSVHPVNVLVGGFGRAPTLDELVRLRDELVAGVDDCVRVAALFSEVRLPPWADDDIRMAALIPAGASPFFGDTVALSDGTQLAAASYQQLTHERVVAHSHAKHSAQAGRSYLVGALARLTLHGARVAGLARDAWRACGLELPSRNVLHNTLAQVVELVAAVERALALVDAMLATPAPDTGPPRVAPRAGEGVAATEAPRGTLFHRYALDPAGRVVVADVVTPTAQNLLDIERALRVTARHAESLDDHALRQRLELVVRAYDPCISCAVHVTRLARA